MAILVNVHEITKAFSARPLFQGLTFSIETGERVGLIGPNGAGKSTLLRVLAGVDSPDSGSIARARGLQTGFLTQTQEFKPGATVLSAILEGARGQQAAVEWQHELQAREWVSKLELDRFGEETPLSELSGGWKKRVALARELMREPNLLLLDEPTNHLDVEGIVWLEDFLRSAPFATLTITHDRVFLQKVSNRILELDARHAGGLLSVAGDYAHYLDVRTQMISAQERREVVLKNTLRRETEWLRQGAKARTTKQEARIGRAHDLKEEVESLTRRNQTFDARLDFATGERAPKKLVEAKSISKSYGGRRIFSDLGLLLAPGRRLGLLGANGSGKSTLIRVLLGEEAPDSGTVFRSDQLSVAYFDQTRAALDPDLSVLKTLCPSGDHVDFRGQRVHVRSYGDRFLFDASQMEMKVGKLSGGEQSRVLIALLMMTKANLLVLDEPTNDLDLATLSVLEDCLLEFDGAVILVTHDRYFMDRVATEIIALPEGERFASLSQWERWFFARKQAVPAPQKRAEMGQEGGDRPTSVARAASAVRASGRMGFKEKRELETMEARIATGEARAEALLREISAPEALASPSRLRELTEELSRVQADVEKLYARWAELERLQAGS